MKLRYRFMYRVGFTPWEGIAELPIAEQISGFFDREESEREAPFGSALDLGCGTGIWSVRLAARGWDVTGVDLVPKALRAARKRARKDGVDACFVRADITALREAEFGPEFDLFLDFGALHGLSPSQLIEAGHEVTALAAEGATVLGLAFAPGRRGPLPRGVSREELEAAFPRWTMVDEEVPDLTGALTATKRGEPRWYRLQKD